MRFRLAFMISGLIAAFVLNTSAFATKYKSISCADSGSGTLLVLIHAFPTDQKLWESQINGLQNDFRVIF